MKNGMMKKSIITTVVFWVAFLITCTLADHAPDSMLHMMETLTLAEIGVFILVTAFLFFRAGAWGFILRTIKAAFLLPWKVLPVLILKVVFFFIVFCISLMLAYFVVLVTFGLPPVMMYFSQYAD